MSVPDEDWLFKTVFDVTPFAIYVIDVETLEFVHANALMRERMAATGHLVPTKATRCWEAVYGNDQPCSFCKVTELLDAGKAGRAQEITFEHFSDMDDHWLQLHEKIITWHDGRLVKYAIAVDISKLKETQNSLAEAHAQLAIKNKELERFSAIDQLTGIYNRRQIEQEMADEIARADRYGTPLSIVLMDLDRFKLINDTLGHNAGDAALRTTGGLLSGLTRETDSVGRWGGEEFMVVCGHTSHDEAIVVAEKLRLALSDTSVPEIGRPITASFGIAQWRPAEEPHSLVSRADEKLYRAKASGRNLVVG